MTPFDRDLLSASDCLLDDARGHHGQPPIRLPVNPQSGPPSYAVGAIGSVTSRQVPLPGGLSTATVPPSAWTRSLSPIRPEPRAGSAAPTPSSRTRNRNVPSLLSRSTDAL